MKTLTKEITRAEVASKNEVIIGRIIPPGGVQTDINLSITACQ